MCKDAMFARVDRALQSFENVWMPEKQTYSIEKAIRNAKRKNKISDEKSPLLAYAGLVDHITPDDLKKKYDEQNIKYAEKLVKFEREYAARVKQAINELSGLVEEEELQELENYRVRVYPPDLVYDLEYWGKKIKEKSL